MMALIEMDSYCYRYPDGRVGLEEINLVIERGQFVLIGGPNGSGKSTLARALKGLLNDTRERTGTETEGEKESTHGQKGQGKLAIDADRDEIGMVFQNPEEQMVGRTVELEVAFGPENLALSSDEIRWRVTAALETVEILPLAKRPVNGLSGGELQRVAIAGALAMKSEVLLLDEPTSQLDPTSRKEIISLLEKLHRRGRTIIVVEQDLRNLLSLADWVILLDGGRIAVQGSPQQVIATEAFKLSKVRIPETTRLGIELKDHALDVSIPLSVEEAVAMARTIIDPKPNPRHS